MSEKKAEKIKFWEQDTDTILYTIMCIITIPAILFCIWYLWFAKVAIPEDVKGCVFQNALGLYCPGCGGTRSFWALFRGDILTAICYHPAAIYGVGLYLFYFISQTLMRISKGKLWGLKFKPIYLFIMLGLIILNFIVRNVLLIFFDIQTL